MRVEPLARGMTRHACQHEVDHQTKQSMHDAGRPHCVPRRHYFHKIYAIDVKNMPKAGEVRHAQQPTRAQRKRTTTKNSITRRLARAQTAEVYASTVTDNKHKKFVIMKQQERQLKRTGAHTPSVVVAFPMQRFVRESVKAGAASARTYSMH